MLNPKWTGTEIDRREMKTLGLEQVVKRNWSMIPMFAFASILLGTWESLSTTIGIALSNGGTAGVFWNFVIGAIFIGFVYASLAELASMQVFSWIPTSGGQYFWVAVMAPRKYRRYLSYVTGWLCTITWQTSVAACAYVSATLMQGLFVLHYETYVPKQWHASLLTLAYLAIAVGFNTLCASGLPMLEAGLVFFHILGVFIFIPVWVLSPKREAGGPLVEFYNPGGWPSYGLATMVGAAPVITTLVGFDCSVHMAEEAKDSSRNVPVTLLSGYGVNVILGLFVLITCIYTIPPLDLPTTLAPSTFYPIINIFFAATNSKAATSFMVAVLIINLTAGCIASLAAASRQLWAFARSKGTPCSHVLAPDHLQHDVPVNSDLFCLALPVLIALINIGSDLVLGIILSIFVSALLSSYTITIACMLLHRLQRRPLPPARFSLGKWGVLINVVALIYTVPIIIFSFFPSTTNPTPATMNWAIVMVGGPIILSTIYYIVWGRKTYTPPVETIEDYVERKMAAESATPDTGRKGSVDEAENRH